MTATKKTFAEIQAETQAAKNNSDLLNLANALEAVRQFRQEMDQTEGQIMALVADIEAGKLVDYRAIKDIHEAVNGYPRKGRL